MDHFLIPALRAGGTALCCSFSTAAAKEMQTRAALALDLKEKELHTTCSTIHSEALRRLMESRTDWRLYNGTTGSFKHFSRDQSVENPLAITMSPAMAKQRAITLSAWDYARSTLQSNDEDAMIALAMDFAAENSYGDFSTDREYILSDIKRYEQEKKRCDGRGIDFTDMLTEALAVPGRDLDLLLCDEFQDTSPLQCKLLDHWMKTAKKVILIGDPDQAIHEWMGASPAAIGDYADEGFTVRKLSKSWRVPKTVHALARKIITTVKSRRFDATYEPAEELGIVKIAGLRQICQVAEKASESGTHMFILARGRKGLAAYAKELEQRHIPFVHEKGGSPMGAAKECKLVWSMIKLMQGEWVGVGEARRLIGAMRVRDNPVWPKGVKKADAAAALRGGEDEGIERVRFVCESGIGLDTIQDRFEGENVRLGAAVSLLRGIKRGGQLVNIAIKRGVTALKDRPVICLTTFHSSKGREADIVAVSAEKPYPSILAYRTEATRNAEKKGLYVAVTRTKQVLLVDMDHGEVFDELRG